MTKVAFHGCSFTEGDGFDIHERDLYMYHSIVCTKFQWDSDNYAIRGNSNKRIFHSAANSIGCNTYTKVFVQWSEVSRLWLSPEKGTWWFANDRSNGPYVTNKIAIDAETNTSVKKTLALLNGDYQNYKDLCDYCQILNELSQLHEVEVVHINGMIDWLDDLDFLIDKTRWVNFNQSMRSLQIDFAPVDNIHPGPKTQKLLAEKIILFLEKG